MFTFLASLLWLRSSFVALGFLGFVFGSAADHNLSSYEEHAHCLSVCSFLRDQIKVLKNFQNPQTNAESEAVKEEIAVVAQFFGLKEIIRREMGNGKL